MAKKTSSNREFEKWRDGFSVWMQEGERHFYPDEIKAVKDAAYLSDITTTRLSMGYVYQMLMQDEIYPPISMNAKWLYKWIDF